MDIINIQRFEIMQPFFDPDEGFRELEEERALTEPEDEANPQDIEQIQN